MNLAVRILAILGFTILIILLGGYLFILVRSPLMLKFSKGVEEVSIEVPVDSLAGAFFMEGINGAENLFLEDSSLAFYVTDLNGNIHLCDTLSDGAFGIVRSRQAGRQVLGIDKGPDGSLYVAMTLPGKEWKKEGAAIYRVGQDLDSMVRLTDDFPAMNGVAFDGGHNLYFASSNFRIFHPRGALYRSMLNDDGSLGLPEVVFDDPGLYNGLYYDPRQGILLYSNTVGGAYYFRSGDTASREVYLKTRFMEACDDLCTDISGNVWMTDPGYSTVKMFNPGTNRLIRFNIIGIGQASSIRIRNEEGQQILYISELKRSHQPAGEVFDGRGVLIVPARVLLARMETYIKLKLRSQ